MSDIHARQMLRLTALLQLERRARAAGPNELGFVIVNESLTVVHYRQAVLWRASISRVTTASGVAMPDPRSPYIVWIQGLCSHLASQLGSEIAEVSAADIPSELGKDWAEWLPSVLVWVPLPAFGALLLAREDPLGEADRNILGILGDAYAHALRAQLPSRRLPVLSSTLPRSRVLAAAAAVLLLGGAFVPVRQSVLAPAEVAPREPAVMRAPLEGVVDSVAVRPNQSVKPGDLLFTLDPRALRNQLEVALGAQEAAAAELRQAEQFAVVDQKVRATLPLLQGKLDQQSAEVTYLRAQLQRIEVRALQAGIAVFDDPNDWLGRPVAIGERVMLLANPAEVEIDARLPVADAIDVEIGGPVRLFLNITPESPRDATLTFVSYQVQQGVDGVLGYRVKARFTEAADLPRIGLKGTAKLYGGRVPLAYAIFRRPVAAARQWLGL